jgi:hypothetical protein
MVETALEHMRKIVSFENGTAIAFFRIFFDSGSIEMGLCRIGLCSILNALIIKLIFREFLGKTL